MAINHSSKGERQFKQNWDKMENWQPKLSHRAKELIFKGAGDLEQADSCWNIRGGWDRVERRLEGWGQGMMRIMPVSVYLLGNILHDIFS
eukprot:scaffold99504_cov24-Tisochrysis_lutea.AAC.1